MKMGRIIDGKAVAGRIRDEVAAGVAEFKAGYGVTPGLTVIIVGDDPASKVYVRNKHKACEAIGIASQVIRLPADCGEAELAARIDRLNADPAVHGILVQLPLPRHIDAERVLELIRPDKDVDGFHPINVGNLVLGRDALVPCTPHGVVKMLEMEGIAVEGKRAVVIGRSNIVGKPMASLLLARNATVTVCHSRTADLPAVTREADILVAAIGKAGFVTAAMVKPGAVVVDVGINRVGDRLVGDVDLAAVREVAAVITPVPGGVGPLTIAMLLANTLKAARMQLGK
jgi:methylenetetrahydrofolate dehydrogenase (NADP+)/methenyltetrahydrofolate cyclohydrolase